MGYVQKSKFSKDTNKDNIVKDITHLIEFTEDLETQIDGQNKFSELQDVDVTYTGNAGKVVAINGTEDGVEAIEIIVENIMNADLTSDADRSQDMNGKVMSFTNGKQFKWLNNVAPTIGEGSFDFQGYGTTSSDIVYRVKRGDGNGVMTIYGDRAFFSNLVETATGFKGGVLTLGESNFILSGSTGTVEMQAYNGNDIKLNPIANNVWLTPHNKFYNGGNVEFGNLPTYADNATAVTAIGTKKLYIRTGHGLDITV